jgi:hypothetical protein
VVNLVPERLVKAMNLTAVDAPRGVDELQLAGLATSQCPRRPAPDCRKSGRLRMPGLVLGRHGPVPDGRDRAGPVGAYRGSLSSEPERAHIDTDALDLVARSFGSEYIRSHDTFSLARPLWRDWPDKDKENYGAELSNDP